MKKLLGLALASTLLVSCVSDKQITDAVKKALKEDKTLLAEAIKANPAEVMGAIQEAATSAREELAKKREEEEQKKLVEYADKPLKPEVRSDDAVRGTKGAPITLIEYSDFQCPYCTRGFEVVVKGLLEKYDGKIQFIYKHLPLSFHQEAKIAAQYYEGLRIQDPKLAFKFHDVLFTNEAQSKLKSGKEGYLKKLATSLGADMGKLAKDVKSEAVLKRIAADEAEARKFGIQGTPGFIINGVPVKGAYPLDHFEKIISMLKSKGKLSI